MKIKIHKDSRYTLDYHFKNRKEMKKLFEELIKKLSKHLHFKFKIGKSYIGLINKLVFAAVHVRAKKLIFEFTSRKEFKSPRIIKSVRFQKERWAQYVEIKNKKDIDKELIKWAEFSYE